MPSTELYPFSDQRGIAIPVEIIKPKGLVKYSFTVNTAIQINIPAGYDTCWIFATQACIIRNDVTALPNTLTTGENYANTVYIPANLPIVIQLAEGFCQLGGLGTAGDIYISAFTRWAALIQSSQANFGA